ncbi:penicillin-binding transpeptidase domain-containing protein [Proteiniborus sp. MB09-C3]|uniref:peptidoglycan D,D-transpeptidase FtsI family protein n=1 Tax=Proteiniborus sp. MB09-C3 TaxID=3050072 RepID=UPI0025558C05|nr:penicillin-binding transpeptidase domain-containing protein [Proteiniborus sp. MB09-C3]WIV10444.1 penicillin-binding transpeptidase domain-containing protein [Proteiniborus sp. MB09-C3]
MNTESKRIIRILISLCGLFICLVLYISYFQIFTADKIVTSNYNKRQWINEENILRGEITDRRGTILVNSVKTDKGQIRDYKYGKTYSHIIGYSSREYGKSGIEAVYNKELLDLNDSNPIGELKNILSDGETVGNNVVLTVDHEIQSYAYKLLGNRKGSIVLMNPKTGEIYAMISNPSFNPSTLKENWEDIVANEDSPLLNRATMGMYAPGSIFKLITATAAIENRETDEVFNCEGSIKIDGYVLKDYKGEAHGQVDLNEALAKSCNVAFSQIGLEIGDSKLRNAAEKYMFNSSIPFDLRTAKSTFPGKIDSKPELGASAIGQGKVLVTPLNMAMVASAIGNKGEMVKPILMKEIINSNSRVLKKNRTELLSRVTSPEIAERLKSMMIDVVEKGTGKNARISNIRVAGKTGTAENETGKEHAWFIGFAPADDAQVAVAVIVENSGKTGGTEAAPIARDLMRKAMQVLSK